MPDIIIRGMEMPKTCSQCPLCYDYMMCSLRDGRFSHMGESFDCCEMRLADCPLAELPKHGDLIDAGSLYDDLVYDVELAERALDDTTLVGKERDYIQSEKDIKQNCAYYVSHAPVVIPAERSGDGG